MTAIDGVTPVPTPGGAQALKFSTDAFRQQERVDAWREVFGRTVLELDIVPRSRDRFQARATIVRSARFSVLRASTSQVAHDANARSMISNDNVSLVWISACRSQASQLGRRTDLDPGDAVLMSHSDLGGLAFSGDTRYMAVMLPRAALAPMVPDLGKLFARRVPASNAALRMLMRYLDLAQEEHDAAGPEIQRVLGNHVCDMLAVALGATRDASALAHTRSLPAIQLRAMQDDIRNACHRPDLSVHAIADRYGVNVRYVQRIFEEAGVTFTQYLAEQRLLAVHRALSSPAAAQSSISTIAYENGFADLSHFNRIFRQRFGCTPSDVRNSARSSDA